MHRRNESVGTGFYTHADIKGFIPEGMEPFFEAERPSLAQLPYDLYVVECNC